MNRDLSCSPVDEEDEEDADEDDGDDEDDDDGVHREPHGEGRDVLKEVNGRLENH